MKTWVIYAHILKSDRKRMYIGQTHQDPEIRWGKNGINYINKNKLTHFASAILKYGWNNFEHVILVDNIQTQERADELEVLYINMFRCRDIGFNLAKGGSVGGQIGKSIKCLNSGVVYDTLCEAQQFVVNLSKENSNKRHRNPGAYYRGQKITDAISGKSLTSGIKDKDGKCEAFLWSMYKEGCGLALDFKLLMDRWAVNGRHIKRAYIKGKGSAVSMVEYRYHNAEVYPKRLKDAEEYFYRYCDLDENMLNIIKDYFKSEKYKIENGIFEDKGIVCVDNWEYFKDIPEVIERYHVNLRQLLNATRDIMPLYIPGLGERTFCYYSQLVIEEWEVLQELDRIEEKKMENSIIIYDIIGKKEYSIYHIDKENIEELNKKILSNNPKASKICKTTLIKAVKGRECKKKNKKGKTHLYENYLCMTYAKWVSLADKERKIKLMEKIYKEYKEGTFIINK